METEDVLRIKEGVYLVSLTYLNFYTKSRVKVDFKEISQFCQISYSSLPESGEDNFQVEFLVAERPNECHRWVPASIVVMKSDLKKKMTLNNSKWTVSFNKEADHDAKYLHVMFDFESKVTDFAKEETERVCNYFSNLWRTKLMADVTIKIQGQHIQAHRVVLSSGSPVFAAMFHNDCMENRARVIEIQDVESDVMEQLLAYIYIGDVELDDLKVDCLLIAADKYAVDSLKEKCTRYLIQNLTVENAIDALVLSYLHNFSRLFQSVLDYMSTHSRLVSSQNEWMEVMQMYPDLCFTAMRVMGK